MFRAWTQPDLITQWWLPENFSDPSAEVDLRVGGAFRIGMRPPEGERFYAVGTFREVTAPERLVYTWRWEPSGPMDAGETLVTVEFKERGRDTEITLVHERLASEKERDEHQEGWTGCLDRLARVVA